MSRFIVPLMVMRLRCTRLTRGLGERIETPGTREWIGTSLIGKIKLSPGKIDNEAARALNPLRLGK